MLDRRLLCFTLLTLAACSDGSGGGDASRDGADGARADGNSADTNDIVSTDAADATSDTGTCGGATCAIGQRCAHDTCVADLGSCTINDECPGDSYCDTDHTCVPYGVPSTVTNDPTCARAMPVMGVTPTVECEWTATASGDPTAAATEMYSSPLVADFNLDGNADVLRPSIVAMTFSQPSGDRRGVLRLWDGRTCAEQMNIGYLDPASEPYYGAQLAIGDLDGDLHNTSGTATGHPEIVTVHRHNSTTYADGTMQLIAYRIVDPAPQHLEVAWIGRRCDMSGEPPVEVSNILPGGPSLVDLDDDGAPEVLTGRFVFDHNGCLLNPDATIDTSFDGTRDTPVAADVDRDGAAELVRGEGVFQWNRTTHRYALAPYWHATSASTGAVAVADFGRWPVAGLPADAPIPEVVVISAVDHTARIQTIAGDVVFGPFPLLRGPSGVTPYGGAPTAADFDGDGLPEFAAAGADYYTVYDPDCDATAAMHRTGGRCDRGTTLRDGTPIPPGVLWAQRSQDASSSETGSTVFDFNGDGAAEVVYRDECFLRVFNGANGDVVYSAGASSGTGYEYPVVADVDGDFSTEIVVPRTHGPPCPATDPLMPSVSARQSTGFVILRDPMDRWPASRPIWNQHAYAVTNIGDDAVVPRTSAALRNWETPRLNNFRQNVQSAPSNGAVADLTVTLANAVDLCTSMSTSQHLEAHVCNRGTNSVTDGVPVVFTLNDTGTPTELCRANTPRLLAPGQCVDVGCDATLPDVTSARRVLVEVDPMHTIADCHGGNNRGVLPVVYCPG
jgi:hypothetical protein